MRSLSHPHVIEFKDFVETSKYFIIIMDLMRGGDLFDRVIAEVFFNFFIIKFLSCHFFDSLIPFTSFTQNVRKLSWRKMLGR